MKRIICLLLTMCIIPVCALCEKTDDELKAEFYALREEMIARGIWDSDTLPAGVYIVGVSIPVGSFEIVPTKHGTIQMYQDNESFKNKKNRFVYDILSENEPYAITLTEGVCVNLECPCSIKPLTFSW